MNRTIYRRHPRLDPDSVYGVIHAHIPESGIREDKLIDELMDYPLERLSNRAVTWVDGKAVLKSRMPLREWWAKYVRDGVRKRGFFDAK